MPALFAPQRSGHLSVQFPTTVCSGTRWRRSHPVQTPGLQHHHVLLCPAYILLHTVYKVILNLKLKILKCICAIQNFNNKPCITVHYLQLSVRLQLEWLAMPCTVFACRWPSLAMKSLTAEKESPSSANWRIPQMQHSPVPVQHQPEGWHCGPRKVNPEHGLGPCLNIVLMVIAHFSRFVEWGYVIAPRTRTKNSSDIKWHKAPWSKWHWNETLQGYVYNKSLKQRNTVFFMFQCVFNISKCFESSIPMLLAPFRGASSAPTVLIHNIHSVLLFMKANNLCACHD